MPTSEFPNTYGGHSLSGEQYAVGAAGSMDDGPLGIGSCLRGQNRTDDPEGDVSTGPLCTPLKGGAPTAAPVVPVPWTKAVTLKECFILAHEHSPLVTLHSVECLGAELGLLALVTPRETQALADAVCELAGVPSVPVAFVWAPSGKRSKALGWHCGETPFPLFPYPAQIVLNRATGGDNLRTLAHELAHHVVGVRRTRDCSTRPARRYRPHGRPFPETFREMVGHVHDRVTARQESPIDRTHPSHITPDSGGHGNSNVEGRSRIRDANLGQSPYVTGTDEPMGMQPESEIWDEWSPTNSRWA